MKATIIDCVMGVLAFGETNKLVDKIFFPKDPRETAEKLGKIEAGKVVDEIATLVKRLQTMGYTTFVFESLETARNAREKLNINIDVAKPSEAGEMLRRNLEKFAVDTRFASQAAELRQWTHRVSMELTKMRVKRAVEKRDLVVAQVIQTIDDLDKTLNLFMSRVREWYGLHFPELDRLVEKHETYARLVANLGGRKGFTLENLEKEDLPRAKAERITETAEVSMGAKLDKEDIDQIQTICKNTLSLYDLRQKLESYLDSVMNDVAPNIRALAGSLLGARLIALAGGLNNMAKMPASTIQLLGAEKALFRALKTGTRPPKHGIIFQHTFIQEAKRWQKGKVARALAGKLAIAARTDAFSGKYAGDKLQVDLERRISEIHEKYEKPPLKRPQMKRQIRRKKRGRKS
ncbi:MAG: C/D box methylation guide ribonucleoprotein complex aNOP56 subunit [Candidatus Bathyarchaeota archaeon]|nr:MAG: C/D box methylation guide ribonucleoprotein complex aNOP56 subunit [Candidatus Bathyarchaeota archaeon]